MIFRHRRCLSSNIAPLISPIRGSTSSLAGTVLLKIAVLTASESFRYAKRFFYLSTDEPSGICPVWLLFNFFLFYEFIGTIVVQVLDSSIRFQVFRFKYQIQVSDSSIDFQISKFKYQIQSFLNHSERCILKKHFSKNICQEHLLTASAKSICQKHFIFPS